MMYSSCDGCIWEHNCDFECPCGDYFYGGDSEDSDTEAEVEYEVILGKRTRIYQEIVNEFDN